MRHPVIILGMHRSGTTMVTRVLEDAGLFVGARKQANHEALFFLQLNSWLFREANTTWDNPHNFQFINDVFRKQVLRVIELHLENFFTRSKYLGLRRAMICSSLRDIGFPWGWKDPRNTYTAVLWKRVFPYAKLLHIYRNPVDVAQSLRVREKIRRERELYKKLTKPLKEFSTRGTVAYQTSYRVESLDEGVELWRDYLKKAFSLERDYPGQILHIRFEDFVDDPHTSLKTILDFIELKEHPDLDKKLEKINPQRKYAFLTNSELCDYYQKIRFNDFVKRLDYHQILNKAAEQGAAAINGRMDNMKWPQVAIILVNYNDYHNTALCVQVIKKLDYCSYDIIVVDNNSSDQSQAELRELDGITLICNKSNSGYTGGINSGMRYALQLGCDYVLLLNNDTSVESDFLTRFMSHIKDLPKHGVCGCKVKDSKNNIWFGGGRLFRTYGTVKAVKDDRIKSITEVTHLDGCVLLIRREVIEKVGMFDERYFMYFEDAQYCYRTRDEGFRLYYVPFVEVIHKLNGDKNRPYFSAYFTLRNRLLFIKEQLGNPIGARLYFYVANYLKLVTFWLTGNTLYKSILLAIRDFKAEKTGNTYDESLFG